MAALGPAPEAILAHLDARADRSRTPIPGGGTMAWRGWGAGAPLVLLHGGYGSWMHWVRTILPFARDRRVIAADLPGLGESDTPPEPHTAEGLAAPIVAGIRSLVGDAPVDLVGFSFGGVLGGHVAAGLGAQCRHFIIVGSAGLGGARAPMAPMRSWRELNDPAERRAVHRHTLEVLMFADPARIDALALAIQQTNAEAGRVRSPLISRTGTLRAALPHVTGHVGGIWGERDNIAVGHMEERRAALRESHPGAPFRLVPGAGHWVGYEQAEAFNATLAEMLAAH